MTDTEAGTATSITVITDREQEWALRLEMVNAAERFLILTTYYVGADARSGGMLDALTAAAKRGVRVVLVLDRFGQQLARHMSNAVELSILSARLRAIEGAGGKVVSFAPRSTLHRWVGGGNHVKIQVSESGKAIFGSSNLADHSWNEASLQLEGSIVSRLLDEACAFAGLSAAERATFALPTTSETGTRMRYVRENPADRDGPWFPFGRVSNRLTDDLVRLIDSARASLQITSLYCKPTEVLKQAILSACRRGVKVEIFHSHRDSLGVSQGPWISASIQYGVLLDAGAQIYENSEGEHSKVILVDDRALAVGSYNLEHAAHERLIEAMIFSDDAAMCARFTAMFQALRERPSNRALTANWRRELTWTLQVKRILLRPIQRWI